MKLKTAILTEKQSFKNLCSELIESNPQLTQSGTYINFAFLRRGSESPDLIITDVLNPECKQLEQVRGRFEEAIIVVVSNDWDKQNLYKALHIGIDGCLSKEEAI